MAAEAAEAWWEALRAMEDRKASISEEIGLLSVRIKDCLSAAAEAAGLMSKAERAAKVAKAKEERLGLFRLYEQVEADIFNLEEPDFSSITEAERAAVAERLRNKQLQLARRRLETASSDVGFPIHVYGTVIVRDSLDDKCVYQFRRHSDHSQPINSEAESLILTGPKRGLALSRDIFVETDLKIKDHLGQDRET